MKAQLFAIGNRAADGNYALPADGWYQLTPVGEFLHPEADVVQVLDSKAITAMVNRFKEEAAARNFAGLLVDQEHWSYEPPLSSEAMGWIKALENRADGMWGRIEWTPEGKTAVASGKYRFISPAWLPHQVERLDNRRVRPLRLDTAGLTNAVNLRGMVPLSNRTLPHAKGAKDAKDFNNFPGGAPADKQTNNQIVRNRMKSIAAKLGLAAEASEEAVLDAVTKIMERAATAEAALAPLTNRVAGLEKTNADLLGVQVEADLAKYAGKIKPEKKEDWKVALLANRAQAILLLEGLAEPVAKEPLTNRAGAKTPADGGQDAEKTQAEKISGRAYELKKSGLSFDQAFSQATREMVK